MQERKISTLVFLDFEATGIPKYEFQPKATEFCAIAVHREHFLHRGDAHREPRIVNKLRICFHPKKTIPYTSYDLTGLCTEDLKDQQPVNKDFADMFSLFLRRLPPPICLLAHNGNKFDFRLLQAELLAVGCRLPETILCADTYLAFQSILKNVTNEHLSSLIHNNCTLICPPAHLQNREHSPCQLENNSCSISAVNLSMTSPRTNSVECQSTCIQSTSFFVKDNLNNCSSSSIMFSRRNIITTASAAAENNNEEDEVEVIAIKDQKVPELPAVALAVAELDANGDNNNNNNNNNSDENNISEVTYPVIDLTEDSSFDGSSEEPEESDDDSNIIIENESEKDHESSPVPESSEAEILSKDKTDDDLNAVAGNSSNYLVDSGSAPESEKQENEEDKKSPDEPMESEPAPEAQPDEQQAEEEPVQSASNGTDSAINLEIESPNCRKRTREDSKDGEEGISAKKDDEVSSSVGDVVVKPTDEVDILDSSSGDRPKKIRKTDEQMPKSPSGSEVATPPVVVPRPRVLRRTVLLPQSKSAYSLASLHKLLLGHPPVNSHTAEDDASALLQVCRAAGGKFCVWMDVNAVSISSVQPLW